MRKKLFIIPVLILPLLFLVLKNNNSTKSVPLRIEEVNRSVYGVGTVVAEEEFNLKFGVPSTISEVYVKKGESVRAGQPLVAIQGIGKITTPISGTITQVNFNVGENIPTQVTAIKVVNQDKSYVEVELEQEDISQVSNGQIAKIEFDSFKGAIIEGTVVSVFSDEKRFLVKIRLQTKKNGLLPGMTGDVAILNGSKISGFKIPIIGLRSDGTILIKKGDGGVISIKPKSTKVIGDSALIVDEQISPNDQILIGED